jgi:hypothetical protein
MFKMKKLVLAVFIGILLSSCAKKSDYESIFSNPEQYSKTVGLLTQVITHDIFSPPVASRIYAYSSIAAYEVIASQSDEYKPLSGKIAGLNVSAANKPVNKEFSAILAYMYVGKELTFSKDSTQKIIDGQIELARDSGMPDELLDNSQEYALKVSKEILDWSKKDNYKQTRSAVKYTVTNEEGRWVPTPPAYMPAIEPSWMKIRPVLIDSASQFLPKPPSKFSKDKNSDFYKLANEGAVVQIDMPTRTIRVQDLNGNLHQFVFDLSHMEERLISGGGVTTLYKNYSASLFRVAMQEGASIAPKSPTKMDPFATIKSEKLSSSKAKEQCSDPKTVW